VRHVFVHDDTPVDFGGKRPDGIEVHEIPHGPYEVAAPKIGRLEMRRRFGFLTTGDSDLHGWGTTKITKEHEREAAGLCLDKPSGAAFSNPSTSELARDSENISLTLSASGPASALCADNAGIVSAEGNQIADSKEDLEDQSQASLQMDSRRLRSIHAANDPSASGGNSSFDSRLPLGASPCGTTSGCSSSRLPERSAVPIREIRGSNSEALDAGRSSLATSASADFVFLAFGQIRDGKNLDLFLRAMTQLPENVKLLVAGKGDSGSSRSAEFYQKLAEELGVAERCRWDIRRIPDEEVGDIFAACDVVLVTYSAKFRSASGVLNAAISARKPVLASSGPGPLKTVVEKYELGVFVKPDDAEEILRGASKLLPISATGKCEFELQSAWDKYEQENSWEENARRVCQAFES
jgi:glycosyltransferase involved in cell wall biosynthesis